MREKVERSIMRTGTCWSWFGRCDERGRGMVWDTRVRKNRLAHRVVWEFYRGEIPCGALLCHTCDNPNCVNPEHLFVGTQKDNMQDASAKGRHRSRLSPDTVPRGEGHWHSRLTAELVRAIRAQRLGGASQQMVADTFGVSRNCVSAIDCGRTWAWLRR